MRAAEGLTTWSGTSLNGEVVAVAAGAFYKHAAIREIVLPDSVREVQIEAARECPALQTLTLGSGTETLGSGAFERCEKLSQVIIPEKIPFARLKIVASHMIIFCKSLILPFLLN